MKLDSGPEDISSAGFPYFYLGETGKEAGFMNRLPEFDEERFPYDAACLYSLMGDVTESEYRIDKSIKYNYENYIRMQHDTYLDNIKYERQNKALVEKYRRYCCTDLFLCPEVLAE